MGQAEIFKAEYYEHYAGWAHREQNQWSVSIWASAETGEQYWQGSSTGGGGKVSALCGLDTQRSFPKTKGLRCWVHFKSNSLRIRSMGQGWRNCSPRQSPNPHGGEKVQDWAGDFPHTHCPPPVG